MTVGELKEVLNDCPDDTIIVMSSDGEGNSYSPLAGYNTDYMYVPDSTWSGEIKLKELTPELEAQGYGEDDTYNADYDEDAVPALVLWPTN